MAGMTTTFTSTTSSEKNNLFRAISITAFLTATLDILSAIVKFYIEHSRGPIPIFKYIASGFFGKQAYDGRTIMIIWGIVFHFIIAFLFSAFLFIIYPKVISWLKNKFIVALIYGFFIWTIMNLAVVPLSNISKFPSEPVDAFIQAAILICMIGLPVALMADRYYSRKANE
jgi:hypothetical protein